MIRFFHKFKKSLVVGLIISLVCLVMTGFGVDFMNNKGRDEHAIRVNETSISHSDFYDEKRAIERSYRRNLGELYSQFEDTLTARLNEQLIDRMVADALLESFAAGHEMFTGETEVKRSISSIFGGQFNLASYDAFLRENSTTAAAFEQKLSKDLLRDQLVGLMTDVASASSAEARTRYEMDETVYSVNFIEIDPAKLAPGVADPGDETLKALYDERVAEMELPARASYDFVLFNPDDFISQVNIQPEDVEFYYTENEKEFMKPEEIKAKHIVFNIPAGADENKKKEIKAKAADVLAKIKAGEALEALATQYSEDRASSVIGGDLGWLARGKMSKEFEKAAFKLKDGGLSEIVESPTAYEIIRVDEYKEATAKPLDEVRAGIETELKTREAPAYAATMAQEALDAWSKSGLSLADYAAQKQLIVKSSGSMLSAGQDPDATLKGLSKAVLETPDDKAQLVELSDRHAVVEIKDFKEPEPPQFAEVRGKLLDIYRQGEAKKLAREKADSLLKAMADSKYKTLEQAAAASELTLERLSDQKRSKNGSGIMADEKVGQFVFSSSVPNQKPEQVFEVNRNFVLLEVTAIKKPDMSTFAAKEAEYRKHASSDTSNALISSLISQLKAKAEIDVDPYLIAGEKS